MNCEHTYVFLRQTEQNIASDRNPTYRIRDVYYCTKCLSYREKVLREEVPSQDSFGKRLTIRTYPTE